MSYTYTTIKDKVYSTPGGTPMRLDIDIPHASAPRPLKPILWLHPGDWEMGGFHGGAATRLAKLGYAVVHVEYRYSQQSIFPAQIADVKAAVRWLRLHGGEWNIDTSRIGAWGTSAGAHLAALLGTTGDVDETTAAFLHGDNLENMTTVDGIPVSSRVDVVCAWFPPVDFLAADAQRIDYCLRQPQPYSADDANSGESRLIGAPIQDVPEQTSRANPMQYITPNAAVFALSHGEIDCRVPIAQSQALYDALVAAGVPATFDRYAKVGHGGTVFNTDAVLQKVDAFFLANL